MGKIFLLISIFSIFIVASQDKSDYDNCVCQNGEWTNRYITDQRHTSGLYGLVRISDSALINEDGKPDPLIQVSSACTSQFRIFSTMYYTLDTGWQLAGDNFYNKKYDLDIINYREDCIVCNELSDPTPTPPKDTNTTHWELIGEKSCKDNTPLPDICTDNNESNATILLQTWTTGCCGENAKCWQAKPICNEPDTSFPLKAKNQRVAFTWTAPQDRSGECSAIPHSQEQQRKVNCKTEYRCLVESCTVESNEPISSYVSPHNGTFHEDIEIPGADFTLHYSSVATDESNIAHGWSISSHARLVGNKVYFGSGTIYVLHITGMENNLTLVASGSSELLFNKKGELVQTRDLYTKEPKITFSYDDMGRLVSLADIYGEMTTIERDSNDTAVAIVTPTGQRTLLQVDNNDDLLEVQYEDTTSYNFEYERHLMTVETEPNGNRFLHFFNAEGKVIKVIDAEQGEWHFGSATTDTYGSHTVTRASGDVVIYKNHFLEHNNTLRTEKILPTGDVIRYENAIDESSETTISCGMRTTHIYQTDDNGFIYLDPYSFSRILERTTVTTPSGLQKVTLFTKAYRLDDNGTLKNIYSTVTQNDKRTKSKRDYERYRAWVVTPLGKKSVSRYDSKNRNIISLKPYALYKTTYTYDEKGRVTQEKTGYRKTLYSYDTRGNLSTVTDPLGRVTSYSYDAKDRVTTITYPDGNTLHYGYDSNGNMTLLTTPTPTDHTFAYNGVNKRTAYTSPMQKVMTYTYDKQRRVTKVTKPSGKSIDTTYTNGRVTEITTPEATVIYDYHCQSYPSRISSGTESIDFTYDGTLLTAMTYGSTLNQTVAYTYNNDFLPSSMRYAGKTTDYGYNADGELKQSGDFSISRKKNRGLDVNITDGTYTQESHYNLYGELSKQYDNLINLKLYRNKAGQIVKKVETLDGNQTTYTYRYDDRGRLTAVRLNRKLVEKYSYDSNGNRILATSKRRGVINQLQSYTPDDQIKLIGQLEQTYDEDGYLKTKTLPDGESYTFTYGTRGELKEATTTTSTGSVTVISYQHNALNQRVSKEINGTTVEKYLWQDLTTLLAVYDKDNNLVQRFEYADGRMPVAMTDGNGTKYYLHYDQVGSLRAVSDTNHNIIKEITYDTLLVPQLQLWNTYWTTDNKIKPI